MQRVSTFIASGVRDFSFASRCGGVPAGASYFWRLEDEHTPDPAGGVGLVDAYLSLLHPK
ncbi:MAG: hypothetical protein H6834_16785 [Planctomycetes bacterium]|nr:hypothetical protein [Planctomycetota bacterium]